MPDQSFPKRLRLLRPADFERVFAARRSAADKLLTVYGLANEQGGCRLGIVASRRIGNAIVRNRWKRLLREAFRLMHHELPPFDYICIPRAGSEPDLAGLQKSLFRLSSQLARLSKQSRGKNFPGADS